MNFATEIYVRSLTAMSRQEIGAAMIARERDQGFSIILDAIWFDQNDWDAATIITQDGKRIRLVALQAKIPGQGAFNRLVRRIFAHNLAPVLVEPNEMLVGWCYRHGFRSKTIGRGDNRQTIWYPRRGWN